MEELNSLDYELIEKAKEVIKKNYDGINFNHTVGSALRCKDGSVYLGINVYSVHGACAEQIALGKALTDGKREFDTIVAVNGKNYYIPDCYVIINTNNGLKKVKAIESIPYAYHAKY